MGTFPTGVAAAAQPAASFTIEADESWGALLNGLSQVVDELYSQNLFNNAEERQRATHQLLSQRLGQFRDVVVRDLIGSLQARMNLPRPAESQVEVTALETQLQEAQAQIQRLNENLTLTKREAARYQTENLRLQEQNEKLLGQLQAPPLSSPINETMMMDAEQTRFFSAPLEQSRTLHTPKPVTAAADKSVFTSVVQLARSCAGQDIVFDSEAQLSGVFNRIGQTLEILMQTALKLIQGRWQFRMEFIGATIMHSAKAFTLQTARSTGEVKKFIFAPNLSDEEFTARHQVLKEALDELMLHQLALLDGYRTCVNDGTRKLLQVLDPAVLQQKLNERKIKLGPVEIPLHRIPLLYQWHLFNFYRQKHAELLVEDRRIFEKKMFRPAFIRGYETRMAPAARLEAPGTPMPPSA